MRRALGLAALALLLALLVWLTPWSLLFPRPVTPPARCERALDTPWKTESEWLAGEVLRDLAEMTAFARDARGYRRAPPRIDTTGTTAADGAPTLRLRLDFGELHFDRPFTPRHFIWAPDDYAPLAAALLTSAHLAAAPPSEDPALLGRLLDLRAETLADADASVSARLQASLLDAGAHEDAALVLCAFAWREAAGRLSDARRLLGRAAAHLALARALRGGGEAALDGRVAEAALLALGGREADAHRALAALGGARGAVEAWTRALRLRLDDDWRTRIGASLLERLALYRATADAMTLGHAMKLLDQMPPGGDADLPDWGRIALTSDQTVEAGARFALSGIDRELQELRRVRERQGLTALDERTLIAATNVPTARCVVADGPRVLGWRVWAEAFQRHAAFFLVVADIHERDQLGLPREADDSAAARLVRLAPMRLLPIGEMRRAIVAVRRRAPGQPPSIDPATLETALALLTRQPEALAATPWEELETAAAVSGGCAPPPRRRWFVSPLPFGTTYAIERRTSLMPSTPAWLARLMALSPDDYSAQWFRLGVEPARSQSAAGITANFGPRAQYDRRVVWRAAVTASLGRDSADVLLGARRRLCELDAGACGWLGEELVDRGHDEAAVAAYQRAVDEGLDRVVVSRNCAFLVRWYDTHGQRSRATAVAAMAGAVGSWAGLAVQARQLERSGRLEQAEATFVALRERYRQSQWPSDVPLLGFYYRVDHVRRVPAYRGRFAAESGDFFASGLERFDHARRAGPPDGGVTVTRAGERMLRFGLRPRDIVAAVDGWRVRDLGQLQVVLAFDDAPDTAVTVWRDDGYHDLRLRLADRVIDAWFLPPYAQ